MDQRRNRGKKLTRISRVLGFHPALSGEWKIVQSLWPILQASHDTKDIFVEKSLVSFRRARNIGDNLVRSRIERNKGGASGMKKCDKARCHM